MENKYFFFFKLKLPLQKINLPVIVFVPSNVTISPSNILREHCKHIQSDCFIEKQVEFGIKKKKLIKKKDSCRTFFSQFFP